MTGFKKLRGTCHETVVARSMDAENMAKAKDVQSACESLKALTAEYNQIENEKVVLSTLVHLLEEANALKISVSALPGSTVQHKDVQAFESAAAVLGDMIGPASACICNSITNLQQLK